MTEEEVLALQNELESTGRALEGIKAEKETLAADLQSRAAVITDLQQAVAARDSDIATLKQGTLESVEKSNSLEESLNLAVSAYKAALALANPAVPVDLITGDTIESVDRSLESAKSLVSTVRASIEAELAAGKVPAGAPARSAPDLDSLSPREKIQYAVTKGGKS